MKEKRSDHYSTRNGSKLEMVGKEMKEEDDTAIDKHGVESSKFSFNVDEFFDFSNEDPMTLDWVNRYIAGTSGVFL